MKPKNQTWRLAGLALTFACVWLLLGGGPVRGQSAPVITQDLTNQFVPPGSNAILSVAVSGTGPFTYQWQFHGTNLPNNIITEYAGGDMLGSNGDGGPATNTMLHGPIALAADNRGNVYMAEGDGRIRKVNAKGIITTVAGNGTNGYSGDGGIATNASLNEPEGVVVDAFGNLFIADTGNYRIREVNTNGIITTAANVYPFHKPSAAAMDSIGNVFFVDQKPDEVWEWETNGALMLAAGNGPPPPIWPVPPTFNGDGGPATNAELFHPFGVAIDSAGNLYIADLGNQRIREVGTNGIITTSAGNGATGSSSDGIPATNALLISPHGLCTDISGNLYIADSNRVRILATNGIISTVAGGGSIHGFTGEAATNAYFQGAIDAAMDAYGNLYISLMPDLGVDQIVKVIHQGPLYRVSNMSAAKSGNYDVVVTGPNGSVTSSVVTVSIALPAMSASLSAGQGVQFQFTGSPGCQYALQMATNLTPPILWQPLCTNTADTNGNCCFADTNTANPAQFYRAAAQ